MHLVEQQARTSSPKTILMGRSKGTAAVHGGDTKKVFKCKEENHDQQQLGDEPSQAYRPKRKATNAHIFRYLQTRNPGRLEEEDLKKALEASLEECPDFGWPAEDTASCSSSDQSSAPSASSNSSTGAGCNSNKDCATTGLMKHKYSNSTSKKNRRLLVEKSSGLRSNAGTGLNKRGLKSYTSSMQLSHQSLCNCHLNQHNSNDHYHPHQNSHPRSAASKSNHCLANVHSCPMFSVHNRYKPVGKKNIYNEADFFHDGIMEYIEYELLKKGLIR